MFREVLKFWFEEIDPKMWWVTDSSFDNEIKDRFTNLVSQAAQGGLYAWRKEPKGRLAEIILIDQFSRNIFRNTPRAFSNDQMALVLAQEAVEAKVPHVLSKTECGFLLLPYMHSESKIIHEVAEILYREFATQYNYEYELKHKAIIDRFGRYPHRNAILGRESSPEEIEFLKQPDSSF
ncbi:DUF924 family protein [Candidatus Nitrotoga arctica]|uniref:DUF924 domain-containing protein n=1 Tax=Candidatus Nitrotoga arctica TaxID=453162 RepID=A0ABM8YZ05_9PROT|nr:DUF924 family protein [Candidatus Nitrotoga arctica]CAG9932714.1 conserved protein of unknown function [Candidatus Nitrotoga arctica]